MRVGEYVLKVHGRCDLACDHCYVYEHADQSWRDKPRSISPALAEQAARRIAEHAVAHGLPRVRVILHGGEPLLLGRAGMRRVLTTLVSHLAPVTGLDLRVHTNGTLLDASWCELFEEFGVLVGVSLDGDRAANDKHRRFAGGRSSHPQVTRALRTLRAPRFRHLYGGILCTVDVTNDPLDVYEALLAEEPPRIDFLLPHANWDEPPFRPENRPYAYADWLGRIYRRWNSDGRPVAIRIFDGLREAVSGEPGGYEAFGLDAVDLLVIDTDGSWELSDSLKSAFHGAAATGKHVTSHSVDDVAAHPAMRLRPELCATCRACPVVAACGGGLLAHRYRSANGFDNPSVYCPDLMALIGEVAADVPSPRPRGSAARRDGQGGHATMSAQHMIPDGAFEALAGGAGDLASVRALREMRLSVTRALVSAVAGGAEGRSELLSAAAGGWRLLCALDAERPQAVQEVFEHPHVQAWAARCLRPPPGAHLDLDRAHLAGVALAAAVRAGVAAELPVPVRDGMVHLPTCGAFVVDPPSGEDTVVVTVSPEGPAIEVSARWLPARQTGALAVDDLDPFRDCHTRPVTGRLSADSWSSWRGRIEAARRRLERLVPSYAGALDEGLRTVVPLVGDPAGDRSSTSRHSFGAVAVALPDDHERLADLLVHEFQHLKLNALLDVYELHDTRDRRRLRVPWRPDPRPVEGVIHGVYAHLALAHLDRARAREAEDADARRRFRRYQKWVFDISDDLLSSGALTVTGERFVATMRRAAEGDLDKP